MSYWQYGYKRVRAGEEKWYVPDEPGCYVIEVAAGANGTLLYVGSSSRMQTNRFYSHHHWMKKFNVVSVRWKKSRKRGDYAMEEVRLRWWLGLRGRTLNIKETSQPQMAVSINNHEAVDSFDNFKEIVATDATMNVADDLIKLLLKDGD